MTSRKGKEAVFSSLAKSLLDDIVDSTDPSPRRAHELLMALQAESTATTAKDESTNSTPTAAISIEILQNTKIGKVLTRTLKSCSRHRRTSNEQEVWDAAITVANELLAAFKKAADDELLRKKQSATSTESENGIVGLPSSVSAYRQRLISQKKEMYKDPPALPPGNGGPIQIELKLVSTKPKRNTTSGELTFACGADTTLSPLLRDFHPNRTPAEVLRAGSFGGTYFRPIISAVTNIKYTSSSVLDNTVLPEWIADLDKSTMLTSSTYRPQVNKYGVKCGGSLGMWESSGWISDSDPYGWFQWYCRFYSGRRCSDDARQISRWMKSAGVKGRFRSQICNKIIAAGARAEDARISPVIRQTLLHWGLEITEHVLEMHRKRK
ncbi:hypothetical protein ACHAWU_005237 [Discostella pseudostelligera]|uniref:Uncharacterized protein n=1 Tax=Discostella pseudostelligera TaxID=259834 RepID=A0ABD3M7D3_9STRA